MSELTDLQARLTLYLAAEKAVLEGNQSWSSPDGMVYTRADLGKIQLAIRNLRHEISILSGSGYAPQRFVFGGRS